MRKFTVLFAFAIVAACASNPASNPNTNGGTTGSAGDQQVNCVAKGGLLVSKKGGGWWCKMNGQLLPLSQF